MKEKLGPAEGLSNTLQLMPTQQPFPFQSELEETPKVLQGVVSHLVSTDMALSPEKGEAEHPRAGLWPEKETQTCRRF